jgi:hypothetical protein
VRPRSAALRGPEARLAEAIGLAEALDLQVAEGVVVPLRSTTPATLFGSGKVEELKAYRDGRNADVMVVDDDLTPVQQRNLERAWDAKVIDRTGLILEIFARRARTREGKLQVELARLAYERSRLVGPGLTWSVSGAASASWEGLVRPRSKRTVDSWPTGSRGSRPIWRTCAAPVACIAPRANARRSRPWRWWATPTRASPLCSTV